MNIWTIFAGVFYAYLFTSNQLYSFVYDVEPCTHSLDEYIDYTSSPLESPLSYSDWESNQQQIRQESSNRFLGWVGDQCDSAFNSDCQPSMTYDP